MIDGFVLKKQDDDIQQFQNSRMREKPIDLSIQWNIRMNKQFKKKKISSSI